MCHPHKYENADTQDKKKKVKKWLLVVTQCNHLLVHNLFKLLASYPVLFVLLFVFSVSIHVGAHTRVAGRAGNTADAVGGVLSLDAQIWLLALLLLLLLLWTAITASWGDRGWGKDVWHYNVSHDDLSPRHVYTEPLY